MKTLILGLDAFDPTYFEALHEQGKLPHLTKFVESNGYSRFEVANPPQSEVSWTSIATGLNPGEHGLFDFVHRNPKNYALHVSLLPTGRGLGGTQFIRPYNATTIFDIAADKGYPATSLWWPATFPARPESPVRTLPGLGTPDIQGRLGIGALYTANKDVPEKMGKTPVRQLSPNGANRYRQTVEGPMLKKTSDGVKHASIDLEIHIKNDREAEIKIGKLYLDLTIGKWSPIIELQFKVGLFMTIRAITRIVVTQLQPEPQFYMLPLQIQPTRSPWRYGTPPGFVKDSWKNCGPFLTLGWPQDTTGLDDGCIDDEQFLSLCDSIFEARQRVLMHLLQTFQEGLFASVFDTMDRVQHMFWHNRPDIIEKWYLRMDALVGEVQKVIDTDTRLVIVSDHGFNKFEQKVHLNRWLIDQDYLTPKNGNGKGSLKETNWMNSKAYAVGLNSIYLNLQGREGSGAVSPTEQSELTGKLTVDLLSWKDLKGKPVVQKVWRNADAFTGPHAAYGPDLVIGFSPGYRASAQTGLGEWEATSLETNNDHWGADHCFDPAAVPGVIFANNDLANYPKPSYRDFPAISINASPISDGGTPPPTLSDDEDEEAVEERLKSLGYL